MDGPGGAQGGEERRNSGRCGVGTAKKIKDKSIIVFGGVRCEKFNSSAYSGSLIGQVGVEINPSMDACLLVDTDSLPDPRVSIRVILQ